MGELFRRFWLPAVTTKDVGAPDSAPVRISRCLLLLILTPVLFVRSRPGAARCAADDLLRDTSRTTGVLGVAITPRGRKEGIAALKTRGMSFRNERCREKSMR